MKSIISVNLTSTSFFVTPWKQGSLAFGRQAAMVSLGYIFNIIL